MTREQNAVEIRTKLSKSRGDVVTSLHRFLSVDRADKTKKRDALLTYQRTATAYFNNAETFVGDSELLGARESKHWAQGFAEDCFAILESIPQHLELLRTEFKNLELHDLSSIEPAPTAYANMQRMVCLYLTPDKKEALYHKFKENQLPVYGFEQKAKNFIMIDKILAFIFGAIFLTAILVIALFLPSPTDFQYNVFRTILALAGAGIGAVIPGFMEVQFQKWLRAGGALAVFAVLYFFSPANLVVQVAAP
ncbi:hypothetical protein L6205_25040 [Pseudomonas syringae pv. syringae]|uniref:hypothetical protein n=1 Tax=Pseudomonas syringae TaxID=317 RepID=UPI0004663F22|nr:hypothetical protein [Pseudomonas syringae]MCH5532401.1 hypothetical protein [Pseudomonas syringae pv. syringae]MCH5541338.1 hypothetical protein [Pseudomonas syringae pv. syringae]MCH5544052.1 hypothetical protein [Pseudomonas syringae pv. syringae]MCH5604498.1 hypothetical protein [Pseudomonas syringae pv. syringae]MCH5607457.1 hypothetical protein [Pseudomonas syringae pv. syringae]